ncbi:hypothetical protein N7512_007285 [Penicillium capsulatum]|nr:hypothetical protein N7512_007285 [Penicillium capsulatum]
MKAIIYTEPKQSRLVSDRPLPQIRENTVVVKVVAVALNPTDWKHVAMGMAKEGCLLGVDYAGTVEQSNSPEWKKGDRIAGFVHGGNANNIEDGSFAEYIVAPLATALRIPENVSFEEASTLGCGVTTVGQGLFEKDYGLGLNLPTNPITTPATVLINGGSSATGTLGIQFAKKAGYTVIATCSPKNFDLARSRGADEVFDSRDPATGKKINEFTQNSLRYAWDCLGGKESGQLCAEALTTNPGASFATIRSTEFPRQDVKYFMTMAYVGIGEDFDKGQSQSRDNQGHAQWQRGFWKIAHDLLAEGQLKVHPVRAEKGGLEGVLKGLDELQEGNVSGQKLVYSL